MLKKRLHRLLSSVAAVILLGACTVPALAAEEKPNRVLTVAFPDSPGISEVYEDGTYGGSVYDWLHEISKYTGWEYEFITGGTVELLNGMTNGEYDLMGGMYYLDGYEEIYNYPKYTMGSNYSLLIYRRDDDTIKNFDYTTLNGKTIGVFKKATSKIDRLQKFLSFNHIECELVYYDTSEEHAKCLENNEVDLLYGSDVYMTEDYNVAAKIEADPYYLVTAHNEPELCEQLSDAMSAIYSANPNFAVTLYKKYFPSEYINTIDFTSDDQDFIGQSGPIRVAVEKQMYPMYYEDKGTDKGIIPDCLSLITDRTGLEFEFVYADSYGEMKDLLKQGKADIIGCYMENERAADEDGLACTAPLVSLESTLVRNKYADLSQDGLVRATLAGKQLTTSGNNDTVKEYERYEDCLWAVNNGDADYTYIPASSLEWLYAQDYYANVTISVDTAQKEQVSFAVTRPVNVRLYSVLSKAIGNLTDTEINSVLSQNLLPTPAAPASLKSLLYTNPVMVISITVGIVVLVAAVLLLFTAYRMKNRIMRVKLEKAEETSLAKSDFLSRMSHEIRTPMNAIIGLTHLAMTTREMPAIREDLEKIDSSAKFLLSLLNDILDMSKIESEKMKLSVAPFRMDDVVGQLKDIFTLQVKQKRLDLIIDCPVQDGLYIGDVMRLNQILSNLLSNAYKFTEPGGRITLTIREQERRDEVASLLFSVQDTGVGIRPEDQQRIFLSFEQAAEKKPNSPGTGLGLAISRSLVELMGGELKLNSRPGEGSEFYFTIQLPIYHGTLEQKETDQHSINLAGLRVLLAEDNDINAEIAIELLKIQQVTTERAVNGRQAVDLFVSHPEGYYDAILMDVNMPVLDGLQAAMEIRALERPDAAAIPILAMTANTFQEDREKTQEAGMTGFLPKPFDARQLYETLELATAKSKKFE